MNWDILFSIISFHIIELEKAYDILNLILHCGQRIKKKLQKDFIIRKYVGIWYVCLLFVINKWFKKVNSHILQFLLFFECCINFGWYFHPGFFFIDYFSWKCFTFNPLHCSKFWDITVLLLSMDDDWLDTFSDWKIMCELMAIPLPEI